MNRRQTLSLWLLLCLMLLLCPVRSMAGEDAPRDDWNAPLATPGLTVTPEVGFARMQDAHLPAPITITIQNETGRDLDLTLLIETPSNWWSERFQTALQASITVPAGSTLRSRHTLRVVSSLRMTLSDRDRPLWRSHTLLGELDLTALRLLVVTKDPESTSRSRGSLNGTQPSLSSARNRALLTMGVPPHALPVHPAPLAMAHAIVFDRSIDPKTLTPAQQEALSRYWLSGGCIVLPETRTGVLESLLAKAPPRLAAQIRSTSDLDQTDRLLPACAGYLYRPGRPFLGPDREARKRWKELGRTLARTLPEPTYPRHIGIPERSYTLRTPNADSSLLTILILFIVYAVLTGPLVILFFRGRKRKALAWYLGITIALASLASLILGPGLGSRKGDGAIMTLTELTPHGGFQWGILTLKSAGARSHTLNFAGIVAPRAWAIPSSLSYPTDHYAYPYRYGQNTTPFYLSDTPKLPISFPLRDPPDRFSPLAMAPWSSQSILATGYLPTIRPLTITHDPQGVPLIENTSGAEIERLQLVSFSTEHTRYSAYPEPYRITKIGALATGQKIRPTTRNQIKLADYDALGNHLQNLLDKRDMRTRDSLFAGRAYLHPMRINAANEDFIWLIGRFATPPGMVPSAESFDFQPGPHLFIQRLTKEEIGRLSPRAP